MNIEKTIVRKIKYRTKEDKQITILTKSMENNNYDCGMFSIKFYNCIYVTFFKKDFPFIKYPKVIDGHFNYYESQFVHLKFHRGITFYEETTCAESGETVVTCGADYQHDGDEIYNEADCGESILKIESKQLFEGLILLNSTPKNRGDKNE